MTCSACGHANRPGANETANVAARVRGAAEPDTVVITAATQRLVGGLFVVEDRGAQALKGVREPLTLYRVVQPSGVRSRLAVAAGRLAHPHGRDRSCTPDRQRAREARLSMTPPTAEVRFRAAIQDPRLGKVPW
jgi:hypothetical protein